MEFAEAANTTTPGGKLVNIAYLMILSTGGMEKFCEKWEDMKFGLKNVSLSRTISHNPTGAIRSARNQHRRPIGMGLQKTIHMR